MVVAALLMWVAAKLVPALDFEMPPWPATAGLFAFGLAIGVAAFLQFRRAKTTINPMTPHESTALVTDGLYGLSRNPIYVADVIILVACALLVANAIAFLMVPLFVAYLNRFQIEPEERALRKRFGAAFDDYYGKVRRWL